MGGPSYDRSFATPAAPVVPVQHVGGSDDRFGASSANANKPFKGKGMQLGAKGAKKQADLLESLGGGAVIEESAPLMVSLESCLVLGF